MTSLEFLDRLQELIDEAEANDNLDYLVDDVDNLVKEYDEEGEV